MTFLFFSFYHHLFMLRLWPSSPQLTPRAEYHENHHPLLAGPPSANSDLTPLATPTAFGAFPVAPHLSIHAPVFNMQQPPPGKKKASSPPPVATSRGQIHVKLIQARGLNVRSIHARPYVVVQFEQNEFVSRDPIPESDKEVKGTPINLSRQTSSNAINALGAIAAQRKNSKGSTSKDPSPSSSLLASAASKALSLKQPPSGASGITNGLFGRLSPHNPVWKHEVSL